MAAEILPMAPPEPSIELKACLQALNTAVAVADPGSWSILFENAKFLRWFAPADGRTDDRILTSRLSDFDVEGAHARLAQGRPFQFETEIRDGARRPTLRVELRKETIAGQALLLIECQDVSKQKEAEYMLDSYSRMAEKNARELMRERDRVERLLLNIMPRSVYEEMKDFGTATPQRFDAASVLMLDFVGFTSMAVTQDPSALVAELNDIFSAFDRMVELFDCERIKTIGDAYMAVSGLPESNPDHANNIARVALRMRRYLNKRNASNPNQWLCRIGITTGPVIGSLVGIQKYVYDIFGPAVNLASRLETLAETMQILVSAETARVIEDDFVLSARGDYNIKGFGPRMVYSLDEEVRR